MTRRNAERIEIVCQSCGVIAELHRSRTAPRPRFCDCPQPETVRTSTRPRHCITCSTRLNRYNPGSECGPCLHARQGGLAGI
jgi:hypothetical protein